MPDLATPTQAILELSPYLKHLSKRLRRPSGPRLAEHPNYDPVLTTAEAADYCGLHPKTLTEDAHAGLLPYLRRSDSDRGHLRFRLGDLNRYLESHRIDHRPEKLSPNERDVDWGA